MNFIWVWRRTQLYNTLWNTNLISTANGRNLVEQFEVETQPIDVALETKVAMKFESAKGYLVFLFLLLCFLKYFFLLFWYVQQYTYQAFKDWNRTLKSKIIVKDRLYYVVRKFYDLGGYWCPPTYSPWTPTIVSFSFLVSLFVA